MDDSKDDVLDPKYVDDIERIMIAEDEAHKKPLRGATTCLANWDCLAFFPPTAHTQMNVSWTPVPGAIGYNVYNRTAELLEWERRIRKQRKAFNRRKKQARARTGRRR